MYQDWILAIGTLGLAIFMLPQIGATAKPPLWTSAPTALTLAVFAATYPTLGLWFASAAASVMAVEWGILSYQRWRQVNGMKDEEE